MRKAFLISIAFAFAFTGAAIAQTNACDDPVYLRLQEKDLDAMSEREYEVFREKSTACTDYLIAHGRPPVRADVAPDTAQPRRFSTKGLSLRVHVNGTSWWLDDNPFFDDSNQGGGIGQ